MISRLRVLEKPSAIRTGRRPHGVARVGALLLLVALAGCGSGGPQQPPAAAPQVTVANPLVKPIVDWDDYVGRFEAIETVEVRPRVTGYLQAIRFRDGEFVRKGDPLFLIDPRPFQAALAAAQGEEQRAAAALALARANGQRAEKLLAARAISQEEYDQAKAALAQGEGAYATARAQTQARALDVSFTRVTAPISGRISDRRVSVGNLVENGSTVLTTVVSLNPIHFVFEGSEAVYLKYQRANQAGTRPSSRVAPNPVEIRLQDEATYRWRGRMNFVDNALDQASGTIRGRAILDNPEGFLTPGMFGHMRLLGSGAYDGLLIPESSVVTDQARKAALVVAADGTVGQRVVTLGPLVDGLRVVRSGLARTDRVVIAGVQRARPGMKVQAVAGRVTVPAPGASPAPLAPAPPPAASATDASRAR